MEERWLPVYQFDGFYEVSDQGRIRSVDRYAYSKNRWGGISKRFLKSQIIAQGDQGGGYMIVNLYRDGEVTVVTVHRAVLEAFVCPRPSKLEGLHNDDNKNNNRLTNLSWGTKQQNENDKVARGRSLRGEKQRFAKLTKKDVLEIRRRIGEPQADLAEEFGCTFSNISAIQLRKSWRHV